MTFVAVWKAITSPVGLLIVAIIAFSGYTYYVYEEGKENGISQAVETRNEADREIVRGSRGAADAVDRCRARGLQWNRETGKCA